MKPAKRPKVNIEAVYWADAASLGGSWHGARDIPKRCPLCLSVGIVVRDDKDMLALAGSISDDGDMGEISEIYPGMVLGRKIINELPEQFARKIRRKR